MSSKVWVGGSSAQHVSIARQQWLCGSPEHTNAPFEHQKCTPGHSGLNTREQRAACDLCRLSTPHCTTQVNLENCDWNWWVSRFISSKLIAYTSINHVLHIVHQSDLTEHHPIGSVCIAPTRQTEFYRILQNLTQFYRILQKHAATQAFRTGGVLQHSALRGFQGSQAAALKDFKDMRPVLAAISSILRI